jgi:putative CocE/NonD family hydrolase
MARTLDRTLGFRALLLVAAGVVIAPAPRALGAQLPAPAEAADTAYVRYTAMVPMRDGVRLNTEIFVPRRAAGPLPILLTRTPYGVGPDVVLATRPGRALHELARDGYVFVAQDLRGRFQSEGEFVMQRAPRDPAVRGAVDEASDAYDTVDWLVKHVPNNNGRAGIFGVSYAGWTAAMALLDPHPALRASSPQASPADMFLGDDFHHNGAFRLSYGFEYATMMETGKEVEQFKFDAYDTYDWYLKLGPLSNATAMLRGKIPTWTDFARHPNYDQFWQRQTIVRYLTRPLTVPTLNVAGWWDQEDFFGPFAIYQALEKQDRRGMNHLVVGPWNHGGWNRSEGRTLGRIDFGAPTAVHFRERIQAPFFRCHLHGRCEGPQPEAVVFESGANEWRTYDAWPPKQGVQQRALYFGPNGTLAWSPPAAAAGGADTARAFDEFVSDPNKPVPYRPRPIEATYDPRGSGWGAWQVEDQRFVHGRPDVLSWATEPLTEDVTIAGDVLAELFASTTGSDADWVVKLIDVYPDVDEADPKMSGYQLMVSGEVFRARFRNSFERPEALVPNRPTPVKFGLHGQAYRFRRGHRIMVQVQSSWFPVIDRNPQTFVPNIFEAKAEDFRAAAHRVFRSPDMPSRLTLPVKEPFRP